MRQGRFLTSCLVLTLITQRSVTFISGFLPYLHPTRSCDEDIYVTGEKQITSPNYGENQQYPTEITCQWILHAQSGQVTEQKIDCVGV